MRFSSQHYSSWGKRFFFTLMPIGILSIPLSARSYVALPDSTHLLETLEVVGSKKVKFSKLNTDVRNLPVTITNVALTPLKVRGIFNFQDATKYIPAVNTRTTYGAFQQVSIRGFDYSPIEIDGMRDERTTFNSYPIPDLSMVQSLEVQKGPSSVLSGHSSIGGSINIVRKSATNIPTLELYLSTGSWNTRQVSGAIGGNVAKGINTLFTINRSWGNGWRDKHDSRFSLYNNTNFRLSENQSLDLRLSYVNDFYGTEAGLPKTMSEDIFEKGTDKQIYQKGDLLRGLRMDQRYNNQSDFMYNKSANAFLKYTYFLPKGWTLSNKMMYSHDIIDYFSTEELSYPTSDNPDGFAYYYKGSKGNKYIDLDHVKLSYPLRFRHFARTFQNHLDLNLNFDLGQVKNTVMVGGSYTIMERVSFSGYNVAEQPYSTHSPLEKDDVWGPGVNALVSSTNPDNSLVMLERFSKATPSLTQSIGIFAQDMIEFNDQLKGFLAIRYNNYSIRHYPKSVAIDREAKYQRGKESANLVYNALTYRLGLVWAPINEISIYSSFANFFLPDRNARSFNEKQILVDREGKIIDQSKIDFTKAVFAPTTGYQVELGATFQFNDKLDGQYSLFHIQQNDLVRKIGTVPGTVNGEAVDKSVTAQVGTVLSSGVEALLHYRPLKNIFLTAGYGYTHIRYGEIAKNELDIQGVSKGDRLNYVPEHTFYSYGNYIFTKGFLKGLDLNYNLTYTDKIYRNYGANLYYDAYTLLNVGARYTFDKQRLSLGIQVNNLFNKLYFAQSLGNQLIPSEPRSVKFILNYHIW